MGTLKKAVIMAEKNNSKHYSNDEGIISIMYHRFNENKYPSTNIQINIFKEHLKKNLIFEFFIAS